MEVLFESKYSRNEEWAKDVNGYVFFGRPLMVVVWVILAVNLIYGILIPEWRYVIVVLVLFGLSFFRYRQSIRIQLKRDLEMHGKVVDVVVDVTEEMIKNTNSTGSELQLQYADIKKVVQTKKYIYLFSKANMICSFKKDSFSVGSPEEFLTFLKSKGIKVR